MPPPFDYLRKRESGFYRFRGFRGGGAAHKNREAPRSFEDMVFTNEIRPPYRHFEQSEKSFLQTDKRCVCESRDEVPQVIGD